MVCAGIWKYFIKQKTVSFEKFKKIMEGKETTIDILCKEIAKLKKELRKNNKIFSQHNTFLREKNLLEEYRLWVKERWGKKKWK